MFRIGLRYAEAMNLLFLVGAALAATCTWTTPAWNDGELPFRPPGADRDLVTIAASIRYEYVDDEPRVGVQDQPALELSLGRDGTVSVVASDETVRTSGVAVLPIAVLHPTASLAFGDVVVARSWDTVRLLVREGEPKADVGVVPDRDVPLAATPGGPAAGTLRCRHVADWEHGKRWVDYEAQIAFQCPTAEVVQREGDQAKIRITTEETQIEGWVPADGIGEVPVGGVYGFGGLGMRAKRVRCGAERLDVVHAGVAYPIATLSEGAELRLLLVDEHGRTEVRIDDASWLRGIDSELMLSAEALARCAPVAD